MSKSKSLFFLFLFFLFLFSPSICQATTYNVSKNCTGISNCFTTIQAGVDSANAGDTVYVKAGTYHEIVKISKSGTSTNPITFSGYNNERPIIDGEYTLPNEADVLCDPLNPVSCLNYGHLVSIQGNYIVFQGFEVERSHGRGIVIYPNDNNTVKNCWVHDNRDNGILVTDSDYDLIENNKVWLSGDFAPYSRGATSLGWPGGVATQRSSYTIIRGNTVFNNWGEGILPMASNHITIEDNISYDNYAVQIYLDRTSFATIQRNLVYCTNTAPFLRDGDPPPGLVLADELQFTDSYLGSDYIIINNLVKGCSVNFAYWGPGKLGSGLRNSLIANNTFVNAVSNPGLTEAVGFYIDSGVHSNTRIYNNLVLQDNFYPARVVSYPGDPGLIFSHNLWSRPLGDYNYIQSPTDIIGNPLLSMVGSTQPGSLTSDWFKLTVNSPAIGKGISLTEVINDYFGNNRKATPDIGANEFVSSTSCSKKSQGDADCNGAVNILDFEIWRREFLGIDTTTKADFDSSSGVSILDFEIWRRGFLGQ